MNDWNLDCLVQSEIRTDDESNHEKNIKTMGRQKGKMMGELGLKVRSSKVEQWRWHIPWKIPSLPNNPKGQPHTHTPLSIYKLLYDMNFNPSEVSLLVYFKPSRSPLHMARPPWAWSHPSHGASSLASTGTMAHRWPSGYGAVPVGPIQYVFMRGNEVIWFEASRSFRWVSCPDPLFSRRAIFIPLAFSLI